jgi:tetratricopeptide (TPR) repeat protein
VGGIYALRRRRWGLALAGSIAALIAPVIPWAIIQVIASWPPGSPVISAMLASSPLGIPGILAIIFVIKGKGEFKAKALVSALYREESADAYYKRGDAYDETGEYDKAIELNPNDALAYYNRGLACSKRGEVPKAVNDLEKCIGLSTDPNLTKAAQRALREAKKSH